jgi:large subunit ribosomal protein L3
MGHRKHSAPRHGSLAYLPRGRARSLNPVVKTWQEVEGDKPILLGAAAFKAGTIHVYTVDDREKTPNFGKPLFNTATVLEAPPIHIVGSRLYEKRDGVLEVLDEVYSKSQPKELTRLRKFKDTASEKHLEALKASLDNVEKITAICALSPKETGLAQKTPFLFEVKVGGGKIEAQFEYIKSILGKTVKISDIFQPGKYVDTIGVTRGKGFEGVITRMGVKRKQHKSRKTVRAVGTIGPWSPHAIMYTVPAAGQMGLHRRTEYNKRVIAVGNPAETPINPDGGFLHYGNVKSDYILVKGNVQGPPKRFIKMRYAIRIGNRKIQPPKILEVSTIRSNS